MNEPRGSNRNLYIGGYAVFLLGVFLLYYIVRYSVSEGLSTNFPKLALFFNAHNTGAVNNLVAYELDSEIKRRNQAKGKPDPGSAVKAPADFGFLKRKLISALSVQPISAKAFRLLGQISALEGDKKTTREMMAQSVKLSLEDAFAVDYMMNQALLANNAREAIFYADILMRSDRSQMLRLTPLIARLFDFPAAQGELARKLGVNPPWRNEVLNSIPSSGISDPQAPFLVFAAMGDSPNPISEKEISGYVSYLLNQRLYAFAYSIWRQFLPQEDAKEVGAVFNGSFDREPSGLPFDWSLRQTFPIKAGIAARSDDKNNNALFVSFGLSRTPFQNIQEMILLKPGVYHVKGEFQGELLAARGFQWRVTCVDGGKAGESQMLVGRVPKWETFEFDVTIPDDKCVAQYLTLTHTARSPSERLVSGYMWFDNLQISDSPAKQSSAP